MLTFNFYETNIYELLKENYNDERIKAIYASLPEEEQQILDYRIGINGDPLSRRAIAEAMSITIDKVRGIEERALKHLKHPARIQYLNEVVDPNYHASDRAKEFFSKPNKKM